MVNNQRFQLTTQSKGNHLKGLHTTQIKQKTKNKSVYIFQAKSANSFTISVKDGQGNLFDFKDMRPDFVFLGNPVVYDGREEGQGSCR